MIEREKVNVDNELLILSNAIMDSSVMGYLYRRYKTGELRTGHFTKEYKNIFRWIILYFKKHGKAPKHTIQNIYDNKKKNLNKDQRELTEAYLERLADDYQNQQEDSNVDPEYIRSDVLPNFIREREILYMLEKAGEKIDRGLPDEAEEIVSSYKPILIEEEDENLGVFFPLTRDDLQSVSSESFNEEDVVYRFEGNQEAIKSIVGDLRKGWLVAITGIEKSGKSYLLEEIGYTAAMYQEKKVLKINLELSKTLQRERLWKRISGSTDLWQAGDSIYPVFDCENNQYGTCGWPRGRKKRLRKKEPLLSSPSQLVYYEDHKLWAPCDRCRTRVQRKNQKENKRFLPALFYDYSKLKVVSKKVVRRAMRKTEKWANLENYRVKCFPRFSVTFDEIRSYIFRYIEKTGWHPDIIIIDYLDITAQEHPEIRIDIDGKWKKASRLAGELNCLVLNADQANKAARTAYKIDKTSTSESKTKDGHLDVRIAINQTTDEKDLNIARINTLFHRHIDFNERREILVTQRLEVSQPILDSVRIFETEKKYPVITKKYL